MTTKKLLQDDDLIAYLDNIEDAGMEVTRQWHDMWKMAIMYTWNEQMCGIKKNPDWDYIVVNYIYPLMMQGIAKLSKNNPKVLGRAWNDEEANYAEKWQGLIQFVWEQVLDMRVDVTYALLDAAVFGYAVGRVYWQNKVEWDEARKIWTGDVRHMLVHPTCFWVDPAATRIKNARGLGMVRKVELDWAISQYPKFGKELTAEAENSADYDKYECGFDYGFLRSATTTPIVQNQNASTLHKICTSIVSLITGGSSKNTTASSGKDSKKYVWLKETYFKDEYEEHVKIEDNIPTKDFVASGEAYIENGSGRVLWTKTNKEVGLDEYPKQITAEYDKPKFPNGRYVIRVGKTILNPELDDQIYKFSRWPFTVMPHHILPHMWQGMNGVESCRGAQDMLNVTIAHLIQHTKLAADPRLIVEENTLALDKKGKPKLIKSKTGEIIVVQKGRREGIGKLESSRLGAEVYTLVDYLRKDIETQQFMHPTAQGARAGSNITAQEAARMDTNAHDMIAMRSLLLDKWIEGTASNIAELIQEYYDTARRIRIIGSDGETRNEMMSDALKKVQWDLEIEPGSTLPLDEDKQANSYAAAYKYLADPNLNPMLEDMLRVLKIANRSKILQKHKLTQIFKQFIQISQQAMVMQQQAQQAAGNQEANPEQIKIQMLAIQQKIMQQVMALMQEASKFAAKGAA